MERTSTERTRSLADEPMEVDPVCGMEVPRKHAPVDLYFEGQHVYFCSETCKRKFELEPARYTVSNLELK